MNTSPNRLILAALLGSYVLTIPFANYLIGNVGTECIPNGPCVIPVGFGLTAPSGVLMVGIALVLRDVIQRQFGLAVSLLAIVIGTILSIWLASPQIAIASAAAFLLAELADTFVYTPLQRRHLIPAVVASGVVGALVDSVVFVWLAFGSLAFVEGQILGKLWMTLLSVPIIMLLRSRVPQPAAAQ